MFAGCLLFACCELVLTCFLACLVKADRSSVRFLLVSPSLAIMLPSRKREEAPGTGGGMLDRLKKLKAADTEAARTSGGSSSGSKGVTLPGFERASGNEGVPSSPGELLIMNKSQAESCDVVTGVFPVLSVPTLLFFTLHNHYQPFPSYKWIQSFSFP